jgi:hypothetical protein
MGRHIGIDLPHLGQLGLKVVECLPQFFVLAAHPLAPPGS